jgi:prepilin-type N-terminal cleavage/methylation domain-containing protein
MMQVKFEAARARIGMTLIEVLIASAIAGRGVGAVTADL